MFLFSKVDERRQRSRKLSDLGIGDLSAGSLERINLGLDFVELGLLFYVPIADFKGLFTVEFVFLYDLNGAFELSVFECFCLDIFIFDPRVENLYFMPKVYDKALIVYHILNILL